MILNNYQVGDEVIVVDDGSTDNSGRVLRKFEEEFDSLLILRGKAQGLAHALNLGFSESSTDWIARYDVDDAYSGARIIEQRKCISDEVSVVFADYSMRLSNGLNMGYFPSPITGTATKLSLLSSQQTAHSVALINKTHFYEAGGYIEDEFPAEDLGLWLRICRIGNLVSVPINLLTYQLSNTSTSGTRQRQARMMKSKLTNEIGIRLPTNSELESYLHTTIEDYRNYSYFGLRSFLLLQNVKLASELGLASSKLSQDLRKKHLPRLLSKSSDIPVAIGFKIARTLYRELG